MPYYTQIAIQQGGKYTMHERESALKEWIPRIINNKDYRLTALAGDASFRKYFRLEYNGLSQIIMDAPPDKENIQAFIKIAKILNIAGINTPQILAENLSHGFLLLSDFGNKLLIDELNMKTIDRYYKEAIHILFKIQSCPLDNTIAIFNKDFMLSELNMCIEWFFYKYLCLKLSSSEQTLIEETFFHLASTLALLPQVFIHRDYHSRNLMVLENESFGVLDFQDAMSGPFTYDLVSLLKDCYIAWPRTNILDFANYYYQLSTQAQAYSLPQFFRFFEFCGLQRHIKVLGNFSRLYFRDNKPAYLKHLPLILKYILECCEIYEELHPFGHFLQNRVYLP